MDAMILGNKYFFFQIPRHCNHLPKPAFLIICTNHSEILLSYEILEGENKKENIF